MDATVYPTEVELLHALLPLVPPTTLQSVLDDIGLGSVPHHRLLEEALASTVQVVPTLCTRLFRQVHLTIEQAADLLRTTPSTLTQLVQANVLPAHPPEQGAPAQPVIAALELLKHRSPIQR